MSPAETTPSASVDRLPSQPRSMTITDELNRLKALLVDACPADATISFSFDDRLHVHIDVRRMEDLLLVELLLPKLAAGLFHTVQRAQAPRHGFGHRVTALVDR